MKITIDSEIVEAHNLSKNEFLLLLFIANGGIIENCINSLVSKNKLVYTLDTPRAPLTVKDEIQTILLDSDKNIKSKQDDFDSLANKLREIFPKGSKLGTNYSWRGSTAEISRKLKNLVVKYKCKFTEEEAIEATKAYVESFNGDYKYMKLLKYFLLKTPINNNGDIEIESEFMNYLENKEMSNNNNSTWTTDLA